MCEQCGAASPLTATWCTQCCASFAAPAPVMAYAGAPAVAAPTPGVFGAGASLPRFVAAPAPAVAAPAASPIDGRLLDRRAVTLVVVSIGLGAVLQLVALALSHAHSIEPETLIRYDIVLTLGFYAAITVLIVRQITPSIRLRWGDGPLVSRVGVGAAVGIGVSLSLLAVLSVATGHLHSDPRFVVLMSEADPTHIIVTVLIGCVAAPLVEETLFRGLLLESLLPRGRALAILVSAGAFAIWHFLPASLVYYVALGAALGVLYLKRGLAGSIAAHVGFNGVLIVAAIFTVLTPSHVITVGRLSLTEPAGWSRHSVSVDAVSAADVFLIGPSDAELDIAPGPIVGTLDPQAIAAWMRTHALPPTAETFADTSSVREIAVPAAVVVEESVTVSGRAGIVAVVDIGGQLDELVFFGAGSAKANADFSHILDSLRPA